MTRSAIIRFGVALALLFAAALLWLGQTRGIGRPEAEARASRLLAAYIEQSGQPAAHFGDRRTIVWAGGWDFVWVYRPCAETAELRITVRRSGAGQYSVMPDCSPTRGFRVRLERA